MSKHTSSSSRRLPSGPRIELIEDGATTQRDAQPTKSFKSRRSTESGAASSAAAPSTPRFGTLSLVALILVATGATVFGLLYLNDRLASGRRNTPHLASLANPVLLPAAPDGPEAAPALPAPDDVELAALESGIDAVMARALVSLRDKDVTPAGLRAVNAAAPRTKDVDLQRLVTCYRVRGGAPLDAAFSSLPSASDDPEWKAAGTDCLIEAIAARAGEAPERAIALAVAAGAAARWPALVQGWLVDPDRGVRRLAHTELVKKGDADSRRLAAAALAGDASDEELTQWAAGELGKGDGFDRQLAAVAADVNQPATTRARAADLVSQHGGAAACRLVAAIASAEPALESELAATRLRIDRRFGPGLRAAIRR